MILSQLINPEDLARLDVSQINTLSALMYTQIISSEEIRKSLQGPVQNALKRMHQADQRSAKTTGKK